MQITQKQVEKIVCFKRLLKFYLVWEDLLENSEKTAIFDLLIAGNWTVVGFSIFARCLESAVLEVSTSYCWHF